MSSYVYSYDPVTKEYVGSSLEGFPSPLEPGVILVPANATLKEPPKVKESECLVWSESDNKWIMHERKQQSLDMNEVRRKRNDLLRNTDFLMLEDYPLENKNEWVKYRQALRDLPDTCTDNMVVWPVQPTVAKRK